LILEKIAILGQTLGGKSGWRDIRDKKKIKSPIYGSRKNKFTFLALRFRLGLVYFKEQKAL